MKSKKRSGERGNGRQRILPALIAGGACGLGMAPAEAVQLGEIDVQSSLGQPLRASIAYALSPNEQIGDYCIFLRRAPANNGLPALTNARLTVANGRINIVGNTPIREPMLDIGLSVNCPYTANLTRFYTIMLDPFQPAQPAPEPQPVPVAAAREQQPVPVAAAPRASEQRRPTVERPQPAAAPIAGSGEYRVRFGDSLSEIASRIEDRPVGLWTAVDMLFAANPDAFIDGDVNKLKAGSVLVIPSFDGVSTPTVSTAQNVAEAAESPAADVAPAASSYPGAQIAAPEPVEPVADAPAEVTVTTELATEPASAAGVEPSADITPPGEVTSPIAIEPEVVTPVAETQPEAPAEPVAEPEPAAEAQPEADGSRTPLFWLAGTGIALTLVLLLFGRRLRSKHTPETTPAADAVADEEPAAQETDAVSEVEVDFDIGDQPSTEYAVALDADLSAGTGLSDGNEIEVAQDFGFSADGTANGKLDMSFSDDTTVEEQPSTDILPARQVEQDTILEKEILPSDADDDYDMSVIVDATKQKFGDGEITAKDLMAVAIAETEAEESDDEYTLSREIDYKILEQDYEDELTATQAMNAEIERAAKELADRLDGDGAEADTSETLALAAEADDTTNVEPEIITDLDDTGVNEELTAEMPARGVSAVADATAEIPGPEAEECADDTAANTEITEKLPAAENDPTAEMDVESGHFRTGGGKNG